MGLLPERKSHKLERSILRFKEDLNKLRTYHQSISEEILDLTSKLLESNEEKKIEAMENLEDLNYEMNNDILLNIEMAFESIGGLEIKLAEVESYLLYIKDEQNLLMNLEISAKNLVKTISMSDTTLNSQESENLKYLHDSYKKIALQTQKNLNTICKDLEKLFQKVKKMDQI
ncbi:MAG: hypothetical protein ACFFD2_19370 [Promethearchaeota archaeon]